MPSLKIEEEGTQLVNAALLLGAVIEEPEEFTYKIAPAFKGFLRMIGQFAF
jgi:hypothetical protein